MGNKLHSTPQNYREKFQKILYSSKDEGQLRARLIEIANLRPSDESILDSVHPDDIRRCLEMEPDQIKTLLEFVVGSLLSLSTQKRPFEPVQVDFVLLCLRLLARIMPILYEEKFEKLYKRVLWEDNPNVRVEKADEIDENFGELAENLKHKPSNAQNVILIKSDSNHIRQDTQLWWPLGIKLIKSLSSLLFFPGFTISSEISFPELNLKLPSQRLVGYPIPFNENLLWYPFESYFTSKPNASLLEHRLLMMKTMLSVFSLPYYREHSDLGQYNNPFLLFIRSPKNQLLPELVFSLLNFLSEYKENGTLPYLGWLNYDPVYIKTAVLSSQLLILLLEQNITFGNICENTKNMLDLQEILNYYLDLQPQDSVKFRESGTQSPEHSSYYNSCNEILKNFCHDIVAKLQNQGYLQKISRNLLKLLKGNSLEAKNTFLLYSMKEINFLEEVLIVTWRITQYNSGFMEILVQNNQGLDMVSCLLTMIHEKFNTCTQSGIFNLAITFLTHLSLVRDLATSLNTPLKQSFIFRSLPVISGNYMDFLITVVHSGISLCYEQKIPCFSINLTAILLNLSPYIQNITKSSGFKLLQLIQIFANYENIIENQVNGECLSKMLRIIDNILIHQGEKNQHLIEVLWRKQMLFSKLEKMEITRKMMLFYQQNKGKLPEFVSDQKPKSDENEQLTEMSSSKHQSQNAVQIRIEREEEEEKKISVVENLRPNDQKNEETHKKDHNNNENGVHQGRTFDEYIREMISWWKNLKKTFVLDNTISIIKFLNIKLEGIKERDIEEKLAEMVVNQGLIGIVAKKSQIYGEAIVDFTVINRVLHEFIWFLICVKNDTLPSLDLNIWKLDSLNIKE